MKPSPGGRRPKKKRKCRHYPNGIICTSTRLSAAIRYFAGGDPIDIALVHGISHSAVFVSVWIVVNAVHANPKFNISYPTDHEAQLEIARGFQTKSAAGFWNCAGAIDGLLIWIQKPSPQDCTLSGCGAKQFFCGRKKKFGLNLQGVCDARGYFLDVSIGHPGSTSDYLAFITSPLWYLLETVGFLHPDLCLYGDNAYVSTPYMAVPFKNVSSGPEDGYNYYQSQTRINIECAFGMLVHRWGILRKPMPLGISLAKTTALVYCLCKLHNFCIDREGAPASDPTCQDEAHISMLGGIPLEHSDVGIRPTELIGGGHTSSDDGTNRDFRRRSQRTTMSQMNARAEDLPQKKLLEHVIKEQLTRPVPKAWQ